LVCGFGFLMVLATSRRVSTNGSMFKTFGIPGLTVLLHCG